MSYTRPDQGFIQRWGTGIPPSPPPKKFENYDVIIALIYNRVYNTLTIKASTIGLMHLAESDDSCT